MLAPAPPPGVRSASCPGHGGGPLGHLAWTRFQNVIVARSPRMIVEGGIERVGWRVQLMIGEA
ncbi:hypothetical protein Sar04_43430 [Salinispora arenicola]|uniref:Uncharacterized protein n=1 Tax=Salinispora arenicola TaxID=168697 RepID=A0ABQ4JY06_SALAC|nr:hypothetical protein Sar04_43430 [Salinispora arenicola]